MTDGATSCKRGNVAARDKWGHCLCEACIAFTRARHRRRNNSAEGKAYKAAWKASNEQRVQGYSRDWCQRNREQRRQIEKSWKARNPEKVKAYNAKAGARWSKENAGKRNALTMKRKAALMRRTPAWADMAAVQRKYVEAAEISRATGIPHEVDHIIPLQGETVSGLHVVENLQVIPRARNRAKHNRLAGEEMLWPAY